MEPKVRFSFFFRLSHKMNTIKFMTIITHLFWFTPGTAQRIMKEFWDTIAQRSIFNIEDFHHMPADSGDISGTPSNKLPRINGTNYESRPQVPPRNSGKAHGCRQKLWRRKTGRTTLWSWVDARCFQCLNTCGVGVCSAYGPMEFGAANSVLRPWSRITGEDYDLMTPEKYAAYYEIDNLNQSVRFIGP